MHGCANDVIFMNRDFDTNLVGVPIYKILNEGRAFTDKIMKMSSVHVCAGKFPFPYLAWGCVEKYSNAPVTTYMRKEENQKYREKE
jgi:hypothetical protein